MRPRRKAIALAAGAAMALVAGLGLAPYGLASAADSGGTAGILVACSAPAWAEGNTYTAGSRVTYNGRLYEALVTHTAHVGAGWNPVAAPSLWKDLGACDGGGTPTPSATPSRTPTPTPTPSRTATPTPTRADPDPDTYLVLGDRHLRGEVAAGRARCSTATGRTGTAPSNGVHPGLGWIPITDSRIPAHGYNVINAAFPVIRSDGTALWEDGMDATRQGRRPRPRCARPRRPV